MPCTGQPRYIRVGLDGVFSGGFGQALVTRAGGDAATLSGTPSSPWPKAGAGVRCCLEHQLRGGHSGLASEGGQDTGGFGGEHDTGVTEQVLHGFEVVPGGQREAGRAVAQVVQPDRGQPGAGVLSQRNRLVSASGRIGWPCALRNRYPTGAPNSGSRQVSR